MALIAIVLTSCSSPAPKDPIEAAMQDHCMQKYNAPLARYHVADATDVGSYVKYNRDSHVLLGQCKLGDDVFSEENAKGGFYYDTRRKGFFTPEQWFLGTPCREWDPNRTSAYCRHHPKA